MNEKEENEEQRIVHAVSTELRKEFSSKIKYEIRTDVKKWIQKWGSIVLLIVGLAAFIGYEISLKTIYNKISDEITISITKKFAEPQINQVLTTVAQNEAQSIIVKRLNPEIQSAKKEINEKTQSFDYELKELKGNYDQRINQTQEDLALSRKELIRIKMLIFEINFLEY